MDSDSESISSVEVFDICNENENEDEDIDTELMSTAQTLSVSINKEAPGSKPFLFEPIVDNASDLKVEMTVEVEQDNDPDPDDRLQNKEW